ncbi:MAG: AI-2E family transporter [Actinomycetota bacterium]|nr:AI-2E family transporter [Actinomycetota bacterium]
MSIPSPEGDQTLAPRWLRLITAWTWRLLVLTLAGLALLWLAGELIVVTLPLVVSLVLATLCIPVRDALVRRGWRPGLAAGLVVGGGLAALVGAVALIAPAFADQLGELGPALEEGWEAVLTWLEEGPLNYDRAEIDALIDRIGEAITEGGSGSSFVTGLLTGVVTAVEFVAGITLMVVMLFFIVKDGPQLVDWISGHLPQRQRTTAAALGSRAWSSLSGYVRGTALIAFIDAVGIAIGLLVIGVPLVVPLAFLVFLGGFLPVIGAFIAGLIAVLVALATGGLVKGLITLAVVIGVQQLDGDLLQPLIMRRTVFLHPLVVLAALGAGAAMFGIVGAFLAVPVTAVIASIGNELRLRSDAGLLDPATMATAPPRPLGGRWATKPTDEH